MRTLYHYTRCLLVFLWLFNGLDSHAQQQQRYNRFQYHKLHWRTFHTKVFHVYFPAGADSIGAYITHELPDAITTLKKRMTVSKVEPPNVIIYPSIPQQYESNIGGFEEQAFTIPTFMSKGNRVVLNYNGNYKELIAQLYEGLVRNIWESQLKEDKEEDKSNVKTKEKPREEDIPLWFKEGAIRYLAHGLTIQSEDALRTSMQKNDFKTWQQVLSYQPRLGGQAFCYFLSEKYLPNSVTQICLQLKKKPSLPRVARLVTKRTLDSLYHLCYDYYHTRFEQESSNKELVTDIILKHKKGIVQNVSISPKQDYIAYTVNYRDKRTVYVYNVKTLKTYKVTSYPLPPWISDHAADQYPILQWQPNGTQLLVTLPVKKTINIKRYSPEGELQEAVRLYGVDGITSITPLSEKEFLLSAYRKGQSDIVTYNERKEQYTTYTDDLFDDANPVMTGTKKDMQLLFVSDRPEKRLARRIFLIGYGYKPDTLFQGIYSIHDNKLRPIAIDTIQRIKWDKPVLLQDGSLMVTHTEYGAEKFALLPYDSNPDTTNKNYIHNQHAQTLGNYEPYQYLPQSNEISFYKANKDSIRITIKPINDWINKHTSNPEDTTTPWLTDYYDRMARQAKEDSTLKASLDTTVYFADKILNPKDAKTRSAEIRDSIAKSLMYDKKKVKPYILQLYAAYFTAKINNDYFINRYQPYLNYQGQFKFPEIGGMVQGGFTDLFENHDFTVAYRIPSSTEGSDFFVKYLNKTKKVDWGLTYFRKVETLKPDALKAWVNDSGQTYPTNAKVKTHYYEVSLHDPLNFYSALDFQVAVRRDKTIFLATDRRSLTFEPIQSIWSINTISYTLNKTQPTLPFLYRGLYVKPILDLMKGFSQDEPMLFGVAMNAIYHQPIYKYITLVGQMHVGYSAGDKKILYNMGGVNNNVTTRIDTSVHFSQTAPYAFQTLVTPLRGYFQNSIYGNQYALFNADLYFPIFQTLIPIETPLPAINNLQLGLFTDAATATETWTVNLNNGRWLQSYGFSIRTKLAGYLLRVDMAYPGTFHKKPVWYFSLNLQ